MDQSITAQRALLRQHILFTISEQLSMNASLVEDLAVVSNLVRQALQADIVCLANAAGRDWILQSDSMDLAGKVFAQNKAALLAVTAQGDWFDTETKGDWSAINGLGLSRLVAVPIQGAYVKQSGLIIIGYKAAYQLDEADKIFLKLVTRQLSNTLNAVWLSEHLTATVANLIDPVVVIDQNGLIVMANPLADQALSLPSTILEQCAEDAIRAAPILEFLRSSSNDQSEKPLEWQNEAGRTYILRPAKYASSALETRERILILHDITPFKQFYVNRTAFIETVWHDLRIPLQIMQLSVDVLSEIGELSAQQREAAGAINAGIAQLSDLIDQSLDAARLDPETGYYEIDRELCDLVEVIAGAVSKHQQPAQNKGLGLETEIDPNLPMLKLDVKLMRRALNNLIANAVQYTPDGGTITVSAFTLDETVILSVRDTAPRISVEEQRHLFDRFRQVGQTERHGVKDSGLGLFVVKNVAVQHNGDTWIESVAPIGNSFAMRIPISGANLPSKDGRAESD